MQARPIRLHHVVFVLLLLNCGFNHYPIWIPLQVRSYRVEVGSTRSKVTTEIESLRKEFLDLRNSLRHQMDQTWAALGKPVPGQGPEAQTSITA